MVDLKYYVATIVAIFLALGVGIAIGSTFIDNELILMEQKKLIDRLEKDFEKLRQQNQVAVMELAKVKEKNNSLKEYLENIYPIIISNKLQGYSITVIVDGTYEEAALLLETLNDAGAKVKHVIVNTGELAPPGRVDLTGLAKYISQLAQGNSSEDEYSPFEGYVEVTGKIAHSSDAVLIYSGGENESFVKELAIPLIKDLKRNGVRVIAGEASDIVTSHISFFQKLGISTVDNMDTVMGRTALVLLIGKEPSEPVNLGVKPTAQKLLPVFD